MSVIDGLMVVAALAAGLWWALSRRRRPGALEALSAGALLLAVITLAVDGVQWVARHLAIRSERRIAPRPS